MGAHELPVRGRLSVVALAVACAREDYDPGDWQVDVAAPVPSSAETMRVCVLLAPVTELGAGNGRAAVPALRPVATEVRVELWDEDGAQVFVSAWTPVGDDAPYVHAAPAELDGLACLDDGEFAVEGEDSRLLVLRFEE